MTDRHEIIVERRLERAVLYDNEKRNYAFPISIAVCAVIAALAGGAYYLYNYSDNYSPYKIAYERLGIQLPRSFESFRNTSRYLDQLRREPCDSEAILAISKLMEEAGYPRESATSIESYSSKCVPSEALLTIAYRTYMRVNDHHAAIRIANKLIFLDPSDGTYRYWRGESYEKLKEHKAALADYISTLGLFSDLSNVAGSEFYRVSRLYDLNGFPCDAIAPLETFISYNVKERHSQQIANLIADYSKRGRCAATYANGSARVILPQTNIVEVTLNGSLARMVLDTGASSVSITPELAARARITPDDAGLVEVKTVGGSMKQATGHVQTLQLSTATAANVPVLIAVGSKDAFGPEIDGLLGMTFLSRFNVKISSGQLELTPKDRN